MLKAHRMARGMTNIISNKKNVIMLERIPHVLLPIFLQAFSLGFLLEFSAGILKEFSLGFL